MEIFLRRRENKKREGETSRPNFIAWTALLLLCSSTLVLYLGWPHVRHVGNRLRDMLLDQPYFSVREIRVRGGEKVGGSEIVAMAGMNQGMNIWKIDPAAIERKVGRHPWVKRVLVRRELPGRVVIEVKEREAKAIVVLDRLYYVDQDGFAFKEVEQNEKVDLPMLTGLEQADLTAQVRTTRQKIQEALKLADTMAGSSLAISEIHFAQGGLTFYPMAYPVAVQMGWGDWQAKLERLQTILSMWKDRERELASLDLSFRDQVVARLRKVQEIKG